MLVEKWEVLQEIEEVLFLPYLITTELQRADLCLSDFYGCFKIIKMKLNEMILNPCRTNLAKNLLTRLEQRKRDLIENEMMLCAIFLDPRFKRDLDQNPEKVQFAKISLGNIWKHMEAMKEVNKQTNQTKMPSKQKTKGTKLAEYYAELDKMDEQCNFMTLQKDGSTNEIELAIHKYEEFVKNTRMKSSDSIQKFWDTNKEQFGAELYKIACTIYAIPPTQVSVERTFSALKFLFTDYRYRLSENMLESLMIVHTNSDMYYLIRDAELNQLKENLLKKK